MQSFPQILTLGGLDIEYDVSDFTPPWQQQEPETILMLHGLCRNMDVWRSWVPRLAERYRVIRMNSRGCGASGAGDPDDPYNSDVLATDAFRLLEALDIPRAHWIGESSGGLVGLHAALAQPSRIQSLVLVNTPLKVSDAASSSYSIGEDGHADAIRKFGLEEYWRRTLSNRLDISKASREIQEWYIREMSRVPARVAIQHLDLTFAADHLSRVDQLAMPLLNLVGDQSSVARKSQMEHMKSVLPSMRLVVFEGYGHGINMLKPDECVAEVTHFLQLLRGESAGSP